VLEKEQKWKKPRAKAGGGVGVPNPGEGGGFSQWVRDTCHSRHRRWLKRVSPGEHQGD